MNEKFSLLLIWHQTALASMIARITFGCRSIIFRLASVGHVYQVWSRMFFHIIIVRFDFDFALSVQNVFELLGKSSQIPSCQAYNHGFEADGHFLLDSNAFSTPWIDLHTMLLKEHPSQLSTNSPHLNKVG